MDGVVPSAGPVSHYNGLQIDKKMMLEMENIVFRAVFSSKAETEDHVGVSHVLGNLS